MPTNLIEKAIELGRLEATLRSPYTPAIISFLLKALGFACFILAIPEVVLLVLPVILAAGLAAGLADISLARYCDLNRKVDKNGEIMESTRAAKVVTGILLGVGILVACACAGFMVVATGTALLYSGPVYLLGVGAAAFLTSVIVPPVMAYNDNATFKKVRAVEKEVYSLKETLDSQVKNAKGDSPDAPVQGVAAQPSVPLLNQRPSAQVPGAGVLGSTGVQNPLSTASSLATNANLTAQPSINNINVGVKDKVEYFNNLNRSTSHQSQGQTGEGIGQG